MARGARRYFAQTSVSTTEKVAGPGPRRIRTREPCIVVRAPSGGGTRLAPGSGAIALPVRASVIDAALALVRDVLDFAGEQATRLQSDNNDATVTVPPRTYACVMLWLPMNLNSRPLRTHGRPKLEQASPQPLVENPAGCRLRDRRRQGADVIVINTSVNAATRLENSGQLR